MFESCENETICIVNHMQKNGIFIFTQLKIDRTPNVLKNLPNFKDQFLMQLSPNDFYVFKINIYPKLFQGSQIKLNFEYYESFIASGTFRIFYDKRCFTKSEINDLKTYNFR
jgi:hypothetical protein